LTEIYGVYDQSKKKYYRVRLMNKLLPTSSFSSNNATKSKHKTSSTNNETADELYQAFYLDYGFSDQVSVKDLIHISEFIQQTAPQAICCKLHGFQASSTSGKIFGFSEFDKSIDSISNSFENKENNYLITSSRNQLTDDTKDLEEEYQLASNLLVKLLNNKPFMATAYKRFNLSKRIDNRLPLQSDNLKPIEIVIHLFKPEEFEQNVLLNNSNYVNDINDLKTDLKFRNASYLLKHLIEDTKNKSKNKNSQLQQQKLQYQKSFQQQNNTILRLDLLKHLNEKQELAGIQFGHIVSLNQFYLLLDQTELSAQMRKDYGDSMLMMQMSHNHLNEKDLRKDLPCAYVVRNQLIYKLLL
jgi:hypothetical protein